MMLLSGNMGVLSPTRLIAKTIKNPKKFVPSFGDSSRGVHKRSDSFSIQTQLKTQLQESEYLREYRQKLDVWNRHVFQKSSFRNNVLCGTLKKDCSSKWKKKQIKRYFEIDFDSAILTIKKSKDDDDVLDQKQVVFGDIISVEIPQGPESTQYILNAPHGYEYPFVLKTKLRDWVLYAQYFNERQMWIDGFTFAIHSAKEAKKLIEFNDQQLMKKQAEMIKPRHRRVNSQILSQSNNDIHESTVQITNQAKIENERKDLEKRMEKTKNESTEIKHLLEKLSKDKEMIQKQKLNYSQILSVKDKKRFKFDSSKPMKLQNLNITQQVKVPSDMFYKAEDSSQSEYFDNI